LSLLGASGIVVWSSNATAAVNGTLTLPSSLVFSNASLMGKTNSLTLFTATGGISNSPANWTVYPSDHQVVVNGTSLQLVQRPPGGTVILFR